MSFWPRKWGLAPFAVIGILLFIVTNMWPALTGEVDEHVIRETRPTLSGSEAASRAESFLARLDGTKAAGTSVVYESNRELSGYVQKEQLTADYKSRFGERVPTDFYRVELKAENGAEYQVDVNMTTGDVLGWVKNSRERGGSAEENRIVAEAYLRQQGIAVEDYKIQRPDRRAPHRVVLEHATDKIGDAPLIAVVEVRGGQVTLHRNEFKIPNGHLVWVQKQDQISAKMTEWSLIVSSLMGIAAIAFAILYRKITSFSRGVVLTLTFLFIYVVNNFNAYPAFKTILPDDADPFRTSENAFIYVILMNIVVILMAVVLYFSIVAAIPLWRSLGKSVWPRWSEPGFGQETVRGMARGYLLACLLLGLQALIFFTAEQRFGMWAVNDPSGSLYNLLRPGLFPLMAWAASISEEGIYRLFGMALFKKLTRSTFLAVLLPSVIWAFSHTQYPVYPVYTRLIEVTILGIVLGYVFLKYGFITVLFAHAILDSLLMGLSLLNMGGGFNILFGLFYIALPCAIAYAVRILHQLFPGKAAAV